MTSTFTIDGLIGAEAAASPLTLIAILVLVALLITKEITSSMNSGEAQRLNAMLNIAIVPLLALSLISFVVKLIAVLW